MYRLIGFQVKKGNFPNKDTGELVEYDKTELYLLTDEKEGVKGFMPATASAQNDTFKIIGAKTLDEALNKEVYVITDLTAKPDKEGKMRLNVQKLVVV